MLDALDLLRHRGDLMDADLRHGADEPLHAARQNQRTGGGAERAADDRPAARVGTVAGPLGAVGDQGPRDRDGEAFRADELADRQRVAERAAVRGDQNGQSAPAEIGDELGEGRRRAGRDDPFRRNPFGAIGLAGRVRARDAHDAHRRIAARPLRKLQVREGGVRSEHSGERRRASPP